MWEEDTRTHRVVGKVQMGLSPVNLTLLFVAMPLVVGLALSGVWLWAGRRRQGR